MAALNRECSKEQLLLRDALREDLEKSVGEDQRRALEEAVRCLGTNTCEACDVCRLLCPDLAITRDGDTGGIRIDLDYCKGCGICAAFCPRGAIQMVLESEAE
jgi:2-oxoacid:acceptor oxidoreductase delta subunit (pyruvate/2-ketoisovalerate family)